MNRSRVTGDLASHGNIFVDIANDRVGIGSTIPTQKLDVTGTVKATTFVGDGSSLTGIDATTIKHTDGNIKAQAIATGVNVTGNLNVSVDLDVTDDVTIGGELNMLGSSDSAKYFDVRTGASNSLHIRSSLGGASNLVTMLSIGRAGSSFVGNLTLGDSSDSSSAAGPEFTLNRNSSSPADADYLGQIKFAGRSDTAVQRNYAKITGKILDASNGTEDGIIEFSHIKAGSQVITGRWRSDSLQLLNSTNFSVAGTSDFTGDATFNGGAGAISLAADSDIRFTNSSSWTGEHAGKIQYFSNRLYLQGGSNGHQLRDPSGGTTFEIGTTGSCAGVNLTMGQDVTFNGGGGAVTVAAASDIRIAGGTWTGEYTGGIKIQPDASNSYFQYHGGLFFRNTGGANRLQLDSGGNATFTGSVTATGGFSGSGANLTSIPAGQLTGISSLVFNLCEFCKVILTIMFCKFSKMTLEERRAKKLKMYNFFEESLEERLAGVKAAKAKLEEKMSKEE